MKSCCVLQDHHDDEREKTVFHNTTPDLQDQDQDQDWIFVLFSDLSCPKTDSLRPHHSSHHQSSVWESALSRLVAKDCCVFCHDSGAGVHRTWGLRKILPENTQEGSEYIWPHKMSHSFIKTVVGWITLQVSHHWWKTCVKISYNYPGVWSSSMAWPDWPWPPYFTTFLRHCYE